MITAPRGSLQPAGACVCPCHQPPIQAPCASLVSKLPAMKPAWPSTTPRCPGSAGLRAHAVYSQIALHAEYGGVVPELASRDHVRKLLPLIRQTLAEADLKLEDLDGVAYTAGPGLVGRAAGGRRGGPLAGLGAGSPGGGRAPHGRPSAGPADGRRPAAEPPFVALLVSGGHTQLVAVDAIGSYRLLGETLDDAAGEAFDKTAKMMGLPYPGGPQLAALAETGQPGRVQVLPADDRPPGPGFQFQRPEDPGDAGLARQRPERCDPRRHRARLRGCGGRHPGDQMPARAGCGRQRHAGGRRRRGRQQAPAREAARHAPASAAAAPASRGPRCAPTTAR